MKKVIFYLYSKPSVVLCSLLILFFMGKMAFIALQVHPSIPPDEITHFKICQVFEQSWGFPSNSEETYPLGIVTHLPYLYYTLCGYLLKLNITGLHDLPFLRLFNAFLTLLSILIGMKWFFQLEKKSSARVLFILLATNIPMYTFLGGTVNYDNLANLLSILSFYFAFLFFEEKSPRSFFYCGTFLSLGALTKISFLPLIPLFLALLWLHCGKFFFLPSTWWNHLKEYLKDKKHFLAPLFFFLSLFLCLQFYLTNLLQFRSLVPRQDQILSIEQCMKNRIWARDRVVQEYKSGKSTLQEAIKKAKTIPHPSDRASAINTLKTLYIYQKRPYPLMDRVTYCFTWAKLMLERSLGIAAHRFMMKPSLFFNAYLFFLGLAIIAFIRFFKWHEKAWRDVFLILFFYVIFLIEKVNYPSYLQSLAPGKALQGRYLFPVLLPFLGLLSHHMLYFFKKPLFKVTLLFAVALLFLWGDGFYFWTHLNEKWLISW